MQFSEAWSVYVVLRCVVCLVWRSGTTVRPHRLLLEHLQTRMVGAFVAVSGMNEMEYSYMKDLVRFFLLCWCCLALSRPASLFDGTMPRSLVTGKPMTLRLRRCRRSCGPRGWSASIVAGALFCVGLQSLVGRFRYAMIDRTSLEFFRCCGHLSGADLVANAIIAVPVSDLSVAIVCVVLSVVCCNHSERLGALLPLSGQVRALELLPKICESMASAKHPSSRRRGVCDGLAGTTRVCGCLGECL